VEYSAQNVKLSRCRVCNEVADKYIEYDAVLVLIDVVLHRKEAYRHYLWNLKKHWVQQSLGALFLAVVASGGIVKAACLGLLSVDADAAQHGWDVSSALLGWLHLAVLTAIEHAVFVSTLFLYNYQSTSLAMTRTLWVQIYSVVAAPELLKLVAVVLQTWDQEPTVLIIIGLVLLSIQHESYKTFMELKLLGGQNHQKQQSPAGTHVSASVNAVPEKAPPPPTPTSLALLSHILLAATLRLGARYLLFNEDVVRLGFVL
jgi:hypothetical protein